PRRASAIDSSTIQCFAPAAIGLVGLCSTYGLIYKRLIKPALKNDGGNGKSNGGVGESPSATELKKLGSSGNPGITEDPGKGNSSLKVPVAFPLQKAHDGETRTAAGDMQNI